MAIGVPTGQGRLGGRVLAVCLAVLAACDQTTEPALRDRLGGWFDLGATQYFNARSSCTAAVFDLARPGLPMLAVATDDASAVALVIRGEPFLFDLGGLSPDAISRRLMSADLSPGLGLLSAGIGPARDCMKDDRASAGYFAALMSKQTRTIYDPARDSLVLVHAPSRLVFYLRGTV